MNRNETNWLALAKNESRLKKTEMFWIACVCVFVGGTLWNI